MEGTSSRQRALVLGGGGAAGNAWLIGVIAGLAEAGVDAAAADLIVGTSAGSTAAAQITGRSAAALFDDVLAGPSEAQRAGPGRGGDRRGSPAGGMETLTEIIAAAHDATDMRRRLGAAAKELAAGLDDSAQSRWRATVAARLPSEHWPATRLAITAVDADTGEPVLFEGDSGVALADAVAASCANGFGVPPFAIGDRRYIDGAYRRNENADLAGGYEEVLVLSPLGGRSLTPPHWGRQLDVQIEELRGGGSSVEVILPDAESRSAFGTNMMDLAARAPAARAGFAQGQAVAERLTASWARPHAG